MLLTCGRRCFCFEQSDELGECFLSCLEKFPSDFLLSKLRHQLSLRHIHVELDFTRAHALRAVHPSYFVPEQHRRVVRSITWREAFGQLHECMSAFLLCVYFFDGGVVPVEDIAAAAAPVEGYEIPAVVALALLLPIGFIPTVVPPPPPPPKEFRRTIARWKCFY